MSAIEFIFFGNKAKSEKSLKYVCIFLLKILIELNWQVATSTKDAFHRIELVRRKRTNDFCP